MLARRQFYGIKSHYVSINLLFAVDDENKIGAFDIFPREQRFPQVMTKQLNAMEVGDRRDCLGYSASTRITATCCCPLASQKVAQESQGGSERLFTSEGRKSSRRATDSGVAGEWGGASGKGQAKLLIVPACVHSKTSKRKH